MNRTIIVAALLAVLAISGCSSLPESVTGPFARSGQTVTDVDQNHSDVSPYPAETDEGKF